MLNLGCSTFILWWVASGTPFLMTWLICPSSWWESSLHGHLVTTEGLSVSPEPHSKAEVVFFKDIWFSIADSMILLSVPKALDCDSPNGARYKIHPASSLTSDTSNTCGQYPMAQMTGLLTPQPRLTVERLPVQGPTRTWQSFMSLSIWAEAARKHPYPFKLLSVFYKHDSEHGWKLEDPAEVLQFTCSMDPARVSKNQNARLYFWRHAKIKLSSSSVRHENPTLTRKIVHPVVHMSWL